MKAALDVHYEPGRAVAACLVFDSWEDTEPVDLMRVVVPGALPYRPGRFYERELPCLLSVLQRSGLQFETIVIDGYVHLKPEVGKGLGAHLYESLSHKSVVIGVAKSLLKVADSFVLVNRGKSARPLFISAEGCSVAQAAKWISSMHGSHRIPTLLRIVDQYSRVV